MSYKNWTDHAVKFDRYYESKALHNFTRRKGLQFRMQTAMRLIGNPKGKRVVDIGCGAGRLAVQLSRKGAEVWGFDLSRNAIALATENAEKSGFSSKLHFAQADIYDENFVFPPADVWIALGLLEYLPHPQKTLIRLSKIPHFIFSIPKKFSWELPLRMIYRTLIRSTKFYTYTHLEITRMLNEAGYSQVNFIPYYGVGDIVHNYNRD